MRALEILQDKLRPELHFVHQQQAPALWRAVAGLLTGNRLALTALGRSLAGDCTDKHRIKAIDRLVGSKKLQAQVTAIYAVLASLLLRFISRPVLLVDWTAVTPAFWVLSASLCFKGRALPIFSRTFPKERKCSPKAEAEFLNDLKLVIPSRCKPVLVTDAGFLSKWFAGVRSAGWDFVGRLRGKVTVAIGDSDVWRPLHEVHELASKRARSLGISRIGKSGTHSTRVILSSRPKSKGRHKIGRAGARTNSTKDRQRAAAAREPLVLVTSLVEQASCIVDVYRRRMQIEETFRDLKSHRFGWSAADIRCTTSARIDMLLLIGALATIATHIAGLAAAGTSVEHGLQANTERRRPVLSTFFLGKHTLARGFEALLPLSSLSAAFATLARIIRAGSFEAALRKEGRPT